MYLEAFLFLFPRFVQGRRLLSHKAVMAREDVCVYSILSVSTMLSAAQKEVIVSKPLSLYIYRHARSEMNYRLVVHHGIRFMTVSPTVSLTRSN